jgi:hypothetical protein
MAIAIAETAAAGLDLRAGPSRTTAGLATLTSKIINHH